MKDLTALSKEIHTYQSIAHLLEWDQDTHMPEEGIDARTEQLTLLHGHIHDLKTSRHLKKALMAQMSLKTGRPKAKHLSHEERALLREWHKDFCQSTKLPTSFVKKFSAATSAARSIWAEAKRKNAFSLFAPHLETIVNLCREKTEILGFDDHPYDALLTLYEPSMTARTITPLFKRLKERLTHLLHKIQKAHPIDDAAVRCYVPQETQIEMGKVLLSHLPLNPRRSRLDLSAHPFMTNIDPKDCRITSRIIPDMFQSHLSSILHETGHALYEANLPAQYVGTPLAEPVSLSIHESQSRFWETIIGKSHAFSHFLFHKLSPLLPPAMERLTFPSYYRAIHRVAPTLIRVEADEVTYSLHVIVRFEIEKALFEKELEVKDIPAAWKEKMKELLGIEPKEERDGALQDIHWSLGAFGYFPTYALGNLFAAQFFSAFVKEHPQWEAQVLKGELDFINQFLKTNIHQHGRRFDAQELAMRVSGHHLSEEPYCDYLTDKYTKIYNLEKSR